MRLGQSFIVLPIFCILIVYQSRLSVQFSRELELRRLALSSNLINLEGMLNSQVIYKTGILLFSL